MQQAKLIIAVPSMTHVHADFAMCLANMCIDLSMPIRGWRHQFTILNMKGSILAKSRQKLVETAIEGGATHLLFIDSDMVFPPQTARGMLMRDVAVLAANCPTKTFPSHPTARFKHWDKPAGEEVPITEQDELIKVWRVGTGVMMLRLDVIKHLPKPWFSNRWEESTQDVVGEDWYFCEVLEEAGIPIYVDHMLSPHIRHIGEYTWSVEDMAQPQIQLATSLEAVNDKR